MPRGRFARSCPVRRPCLAYALRTRPAAGVWAGFTPEEITGLIAAAARPARVQRTTALRPAASGRPRARGDGVMTALDSRSWACGGCGAVCIGAMPPERLCPDCAAERPAAPGRRRGAGCPAAGECESCGTADAQLWVLEARYPGRGDLPDAVRAVCGCRADAAAELPGRGAPGDGP